MKERIKNLLAAGLKPSEIASIVGCTPAYVSQLLANEDFKKEVQELMVAAQEQKDEEGHLDQRYQNTEQKILSRINAELDNAELPQLVRALEVVGKRRDERERKKAPLGNLLPNGLPAGSNVNISVTNIALPGHILSRPAPVVEVNEKNEIIAIDHKPLAPMSSDGVKGIFNAIQARKKELSEQRAPMEVIKQRVGQLLDQSKQAMEQI